MIVVFIQMCTSHMRINRCNNKGLRIAMSAMCAPGSLLTKKLRSWGEAASLSLHVVRTVAAATLYLLKPADLRSVRKPITALALP